MVRVADGDTITVLDDTRTQHKIRLDGIDAPEEGQPFGSRSKVNLSDLVYGKTVTVEWSKRDRWGRIVGKVLTPAGIDAGLEQIRAGMAWWFRKFAHQQSAEDQRAYEQAEDEAKAAGRGLWADGDRALPPWEWRKATRRLPRGQGVKA